MTIVESDAVFETIAAPTPSPYRFGLFSVVPPSGDADTTWEGFGIQWHSMGCTLPRVTFDPCLVDTVDPLEADTYCTIPQFAPFTVYQQTGSTLRNQARDLPATRERLLLVEQFGVEDQLWTALAAAVTEVSTSTLPEALALVEQMLVEAYPAQGVIHMSRYTATLLHDHLVTEGGRLVTRLGTPVVAGAGYDPVNGADATTASIYGTGPIVIRRGQVDTVTVPTTESNDAAALAFRTYVVGWDCAAVGSTVTL